MRAAVKKLEEMAAADPKRRTHGIRTAEDSSPKSSPSFRKKNTQIWWKKRNTTSEKAIFSR